MCGFDCLIEKLLWGFNCFLIFKRYVSLSIIQMKSSKFNKWKMAMLLFKWKSSGNLKFYSLLDSIKNLSSVCSNYSKTCIKSPLSKRQKNGFQDHLSLNAGHCIAECSKGSFLQYFRPSLSYHLSLRSLFCLFLSGHFTQVLLYCLRAQSTLNTLWVQEPNYSRQEKHVQIK